MGIHQRHKISSESFKGPAGIALPREGDAYSFLVFGINFFQRGISTLAIFTIFCLGGGSPRPHPHAEFHRCSFKDVALRAPKSPKIVIFGKKNFPSGKILGVDRNT